MDEPVKLEWMYKETGIDTEEYLLGKAIDKTFEAQTSTFNEVDKDILPASIFASANSTAHVDVARKLKEDPLEKIKQKEIEMRKQLLKNPVKLKKIQNMLRAKAEEKALKEEKKKRKKKKGDAIDSLLTDKYLKLIKKYGAKNLLDMAKSDEDSDGSQEKKTKSRDSSRRSQSDEDRRKPNDREASSSEDERKSKMKKPYGLVMPHGKSLPAPRVDPKKSQRKPEPETKNKPTHKPRKLTEKEKEERLKEMMKNAEWRESTRREKVHKYRADEAKREIKDAERKEDSREFMRKHLALATSDATIEQRIKSNINKIQRSSGAMSQPFARR